MSIARWRAAGLLWPTIMTIVAFSVLVGLGTWQLQRKGWKENLIAAIAARTEAPPRPLTPAVVDAPGPVGAEYTRVAVTGHYLHGQERHLYMPAREGLGWLVVTPLVRQDGSMVLVNRGWVPDRQRDPRTRAAGQVEGTVTVVGLLRGSEEAGSFMPDNEPAANRWFWRDIPAMWRCRAGTEQSADCKTLTAASSSSSSSASAPKTGSAPWRAPMLVDAEADPAKPAGFPRGGTTRLAIPNRHLEYAITWYGLAATLIGVFVAFAITRLPARPPP